MNAPDAPTLTEFESWAALRCRPAHTLPLAESLAAQGLAGWSPKVQVRRRIPRARRLELRIVALLPSFVFVPFRKTDAALELGQRGVVPRAWPFLFNGARPELPVVQLLAMQSADPRPTTELFRPGETVRFVVGPLHGRLAIILCRKGRDRWLVEVDGRRALVPSFLIAPTGVKRASA